MLGQLYLRGKIASSELSAGQYWCQLVAGYADACQCPREPQTQSLERGGIGAPDPDSLAGISEARKHERAMAAYLDGRHALRLAGTEAERLVGAVCIDGLLPA